MKSGTRSQQPLPDISPYDDCPSTMIPSILNDPNLSSDDRIRYMSRYIESRDALAERKLNYAKQTALLHPQQHPLSSMPMAPYPVNGAYTGYPPGYGMYPPPGYLMQPPNALPSVDTLFDSFSSPLTTVLRSVHFVWRAFVFIASWYIIFWIGRTLFNFVM
jgi:hypothetical protein